MRGDTIAVVGDRLCLVFHPKQNKVYQWRIQVFLIMHIFVIFLSKGNATEGLQLKSANHHKITTYDLQGRIDADDLTKTRKDCTQMWSRHDKSVRTTPAMRTGIEKCIIIIDKHLQICGRIINKKDDIGCSGKGVRISFSTYRNQHFHNMYISEETLYAWLF